MKDMNHKEWLMFINKEKMKEDYPDLNGEYDTVDFNSEKWKNVDGEVFQKFADINFEESMKLLETTYGVNSKNSRWEIFNIIEDQKEQELNLSDDIVRIVIQNSDIADDLKKDLLSQLKPYLKKD